MKAIAKYLPIVIKLYIPTVFFISLIGLIALFMSLYRLGFGMPLLFWLLGLTGHIIFFRNTNKISYLSLYGCIFAFDWMLGSIVTRLIDRISPGSTSILPSIFSLICLVGMFFLSYIYVKAVKSLKPPINRTYSWEDFNFDLNVKLEKAEIRWNDIKEKLSELKTKFLTKKVDLKNLVSRGGTQSLPTQSVPVSIEEAEEISPFDVKEEDDNEWAEVEQPMFTIIDFEKENAENTQQTVETPKSEPTKKERIPFLESELPAYNAPLPEPPPVRSSKNGAAPVKLEENRKGPQTAEHSKSPIATPDSNVTTSVEDTVKENSNAETSSFWKFQE